MFKEIAGYAHDVKEHGPALMFVSADGKRSFTAQSGVAASVGKDGKAVLPDEVVKNMAEKGCVPAKMSDLKRIFFAAAQEPPMSDGEKEAKFNALVVGGAPVKATKEEKAAKV